MNKENITYKQMYELINCNELDINITSKDVIKNITPLKKDIKNNYVFYKKNIFFKIFSFISYLIVFILLKPILTLFYLPKVKGKENLKKVKNAVFISNHSFILDCALLNTHVFKFKRPYMLASINHFKIPLIKEFITLFKAVPIPYNLNNYKNFLQKTDEKLKNNNSLLIYPEGSLWPYFPKIRPLNSGAFRFSIKNNVPIIPIVLSFRNPNFLYRFLGRKKPLININILKPVYPDIHNNYKDEEYKINNIVYKIMNETMQKNNSYIYINKKKLKKSK